MATPRADPAQRTELLTVRALLDEALVGLRAIESPDVPLMEVRSYVSLSLSRIYAALASSMEPGSVREHTQAALQLARDGLGALSFGPTMDPAVLDCMRLVAQAIGALNEPVQPPDVAPRLPRGERRPPLRASVGVPRILDPQRDLLFPTVPLPDLRGVAPPPEIDLDAAAPEPPPTVTTVDDLPALEAWGARQAAAALQDGELPPPPPALTAPPADDPDAAALKAVFGVAPAAAQVVWWRARALFDDLAMMGLMRRPTAFSIWHQYASVERRLLARVDAILACGTWTIPRLVQLLEDRPVPDPEMLWGTIFLLGSVAGDDMLDQLARQLRLVPDGDAPLDEAATDALRFAPHRGVEALMRRHLESPRPGEVRRAIRVLGHRRATMVDTLRPFLASADEGVLRATLGAMEKVPGDLSPLDLEVGLRSKEEALLRAAIETATMRGFAVGVREAEARLSRGVVTGTAAMLVALGGDERALELLLGAAASQPSDEVFAALGWYGSVAALPFLLGRLEAGEAAAAHAIQRITGASLGEEDPALPTYAPEDLPFVRGRWIAPTPVFPLSLDIAPWAAWWMRYGHGVADPSVRYRWGHRWSTRDDLHELEDALSSPADRRAAYLELCARTGGALPFEHDAFVVHQRPQIAAWREYLGPNHARAAIGRWPVRFLR